MPILRELFRTSAQRLSAKIPGFANSGKKSRSHNKEPEVFLPESRVRTQNICGTLRMSAKNGSEQQTFNPGHSQYRY